jgi:transcriptional regulator with XRE-family HTH domain
MDIDALVARIEARRKELGLTAKGLLLAADVNQTYLRDLRKGKSRNPKADQLQRLAAVLGMSVHELLGSQAPGFAEPPPASTSTASLGDPGEDDRFAQLCEAVEQMLREEGMPHDLRNVVLLSRKLWPRITSLPAAVPFADRLDLTISERRSVVQRARRAIFDPDN